MQTRAFSFGELLSKITTMKRAIVLAGGGSLGAFEIGVWKYLREQGIDYQIVTGTSIGAINAGFMAENNYEKAVKLWSNLSIDKVIHDGFNLTTDFFSNIDKAKRAEIATFAKSYFSHGGADVTPLYHLTEEAIDPEVLKKSPIKCGIVTCVYPRMVEKDVILNKQPVQDILPWLLCSSACYPIFPPYRFKKKKFADGGYKNNLPIDLALAMGAEEVIAISLDPYPKNPQHFELTRLPFVKFIRPSCPIGSFMNFSKEQGEDNIRRGYLEARKRFGELWGYSYAFEKDSAAEKPANDFVRSLFLANPALFLKLPKRLSFEGEAPSTSLAIYLRLLETEGEWLGLGHDEVYTIAGFRQKILDALTHPGPKSKPTAFAKTPNPLWRIAPKDQKSFLHYLHYVDKHQLKISLVKHYFDNYPETWAFYQLAHFSQSK